MAPEANTLGPADHGICAAIGYAGPSNLPLERASAPRR